MDQSSINEINLYLSALNYLKLTVQICSLYITSCAPKQCIVADRRTGSLGADRLPLEVQLHNYRRPTSRHIHACSQLKIPKEVKDISCTLKIKIEIFRKESSEELTSPTDDLAIAG